MKSSVRNKTVFVTGLGGFIGSRFAQLAGDTIKVSDFGRPDITKKNDIDKVVGRTDVDAVLHLAAKAHIDPCEKDRYLGKDGEAWKVNVTGTKNIARACKEFGKYLVFLSTECVFDGEKGEYTEVDQPRPKNWYGETKRQAEIAALESGAKAGILRSVLAYGHPDPKQTDFMRFVSNQLKNKKEIKAVTDQKISFTFIDDLVKTLFVLLINQPTGIFHFAGNNSYSPYDFAVKIMTNESITGGLIIPVTMKQYFGQNSALRLKNATLISQKFHTVIGSWNKS